MPRHRRTRAAFGEREILVADLARELGAPRPTGQPLILEDDTPETDSIRVTVIWDRWSECPTEMRAQVIFDAYLAAFGEETRRKITLALGVTFDEAISLGLLPFKILSARKSGESISLEAYRKAMIDAGAVFLPGSDVPHLRFATLEEAAAAMEALEKRLPGSKWIVVQEVSADDESRSTGWAIGQVAG